MTTPYLLGVDLAQRSDFTAIALLERGAQANSVFGGTTPTWDVTALDRTQHTSYEVICDRVARLMGSDKLRPKRIAPGGRWRTVAQTTLVVDSTGVGGPVVDMLRRRGLSPVEVLITGGVDPVEMSHTSWRVPKRDIVLAVQLAMENRALRVAEGLPHAETLKQELQDFRYKLDPITAHDSYGAWRVGQHDDLVLAVALPLWYAPNQPVGATMTNYLRDPEPESEWHPDSIYHEDHPRNPYRQR